MKKNENNMYECIECGKEFKKSGSCALHQYRKHNIKSDDEKEKKATPKRQVDNWEFLGKKDLVIKGQKFDINGQLKIKNENDVFEVNTETGALR